MAAEEGEVAAVDRHQLGTGDAAVHFQGQRIGNDPIPAAVQPVHLAGVTSYDPYGDHAEHNEDVSKATDGNPATYWTTEHYESFTKPGVGLVLAAPRAERVTRVTVRTDTPGFTARIEAGSSESGTFSPVSPLRTVGSSTTFPVHGAAARYYVVWITKLDGIAHVNDVKALGG